MTQVSIIKEGFVRNYKLKHKIEVRIGRWESWDVIGIWTRINNMVHAINSKSL